MADNTTKYAFGYLYGWRGFNLIRPADKDSPWQLASPFIPSLSLGSPLFNRGDENRIFVSSRPAQCRLFYGCGGGMESDSFKTYRDNLYGTNKDNEAYQDNKTPSRNCRCGYYTYRSLDDLIANYELGEFSCIGVMKNYGKIQRHATGYRSQYMKPHHLFLPEQGLNPMWRKMWQRRSIRIRDEINQEVKTDLETLYECKVDIVAAPFGPSVLDAYLDPHSYPPAVEIPRSEIPSAYSHYLGET